MYSEAFNFSNLAVVLTVAAVVVAVVATVVLTVTAKLENVERQLIARCIILQMVEAT